MDNSVKKTLDIQSISVFMYSRKTIHVNIVNASVIMQKWKVTEDEWGKPAKSQSVSEPGKLCLELQ